MKNRSILKGLKEFITEKATIEDIIDLATIMKMRKRFLELKQDQWPKKEIEQFMSMEASLKDIEELAKIMRDRKQVLQLQHVAEKNCNTVNKVKSL